jgi:hypothetical protein
MKGDIQNLMLRTLTTTVLLMVAGGFFMGASSGGPIDPMVEKVLVEYAVIQETLSKDSVQGIESAAKAISAHASEVSSSDPEVQALIDDLKAASGKIQGQDLEAARDTFFELSKPLLVYLTKYYSGNNTYFRYFCGMAKKGWVQAEKGTRNPYYGSSMLTCGELIK